MSQREQTYDNFSTVDEVVELRAILQGLQRRIGIFVFFLVVTFSSFVIYAAVAQRFFTAEATIVIESQQSALVDSSDVLTGPGSGVPREINTEVELLRSRAMAVRVIRRLENRYGDAVFGRSAVAVPPSAAAPAEYEIESLVGTTSEREAESTPEAVEGEAEETITDRLPEPNGADEFSIESIVGQPVAPPGQAGASDVIPLETGVNSNAGAGDNDDTVISTGIINQVVGRLQVDRVGSTALIRIRYSSPSPENSALVANAFADEYILEQLEAQFKALQQARRFIEARLGVLREEVRNSEEAAANFRAEYGLIDSEGANVTEQRLNQLADELAKARTDLSAAITRYQSVRDMSQSSQAIETISEVMESGLIRELRRQEADIKRRRGDLRARYGDLHPQMKQINQELSDLQQQISMEINRIVDNLRREVDFAEARVNRLSADFAAIQTDLATENPALVRLRELERDTLASRGLYESLLERQKELNERERLAQADARIITRAQPPDSPSKPQTKLLLAAGALLAVLFASVAAFAAEATESRVISSADLKRTFGAALPVVLVPRIRRGNVFGDRPLSEIAEHYIRKKPSATFTDAFRELRMNLMLAKQADQKQSPISVAFTSSFADEGVTTTAFCFATLLASEGERVVFVDANSWRDDAGAQFGETKIGMFQKTFRQIADLRSEKDDERPAEREAITYFVDVDAVDDDAVDAPAAEIAGNGADQDATGAPAPAPLQPAENSALRRMPRSHDIKLFRTVNDVDIILLTDNNRIETESADASSIEALIDDLSGMYDFIIVDAPPVLESAEASFVSSRADYVVVLVEWRRTLRDALKTSCQSLIDAHAEFLGFVINKVDERRRHYFRPDDRNFYFKRR